MKKIKKIPSKKWLGTLAILSLLLIISVVIFGGGWGFSDKSVWEWMELLLIPSALAFVFWWLNREDRKKEKTISLEKERRDLLATYFDRMENLLLKHDLRRANRRDEVTEIARARTLQVLRNMDGERKGQVVRFLADAQILGTWRIDQGEKVHDETNIIRLSYADLSGADLENIHLEGANLFCANLENVNFKNAHLKDSHMPFAFMKGAVIDNADLRGANLYKAAVTPFQLQEARSLEKAKMPSSDSYESWLKKNKPKWDVSEKWTPHVSR